MYGMCGRIVVTRPVEVLAAYFGAGEVVAPERPPRWNVAPGADIPAVAGTRSGRRLGTMRWGLVPSWSTDPSAGPRTSNARVEGILDKAVFAEALEVRPGVDQLALFGATLHVVGSDRAALEKALADIEKEHKGVTVTPGQTSLEDVFIQFMSGSKDNMA